jgi:hypothetical protein
MHGQPIVSTNEICISYLHSMILIRHLTNLPWSRGPTITPVFGCETIKLAVAGRRLIYIKERHLGCRVSAIKYLSNYAVFII